jgi:asparagine synthase (glutamine-hydrolysing)
VSNRRVAYCRCRRGSDRKGTRVQIVRGDFRRSASEGIRPVRARQTLQGGRPAGEHRAWIVDGVLSVQAVGSLTNRSELASHLGISTGECLTMSTGELIGRAYERWSEECLSHLEGAFAFAIRDEPGSTVFCARDHMGLEPFYYHLSRSIFAFSTDLAWLLSLDVIGRDFNEKRIADYLLQLELDHEATFYRAVRRLPPGHAIRVEGDREQLWRYWSLDDVPPIRYSSDEEYARVFESLFVDSVRRNAEGADKVGCCLSGGLDSSSVTCVARSLLGSDHQNSLDTFSLVFPGIERSDERPYIDAVIAGGGLRPHYLPALDHNPLSGIDRALDVLHEPYTTPNLFLNELLWHEACRQNVNVLLDGFLGDNVVSHGTEHLKFLAATGRWYRLYREINAAARQLGNRPGVKRRLLRQHVIHPLVLGPAGLLRSSLGFGSQAKHGSIEFIQPDLLTRAYHGSDVDERRARDDRQPIDPRRAHIKTLQSPTLSLAIETARRCARSFDVSLRFPFADKRLVEFCSAIPVTQKCSDGWTRVILRRALAEYLPDAIRTRHGKANLAPVFRHSMRSTSVAKLKPYLYEILPRSSTYVNVHAMQDTYQAMVNGTCRPDAYHSLWTAIVLTRWLERASETSTVAMPSRPVTSLI